MMQTTLSVRLDKNDKHSFDEFCKSAGLTVSTAINMFVKAVIREQRIPFEIRGERDASGNGETTKRLSRTPGLMKGKFYMADDFDAPLDEFKEYM